MKQDELQKFFMQEAARRHKILVKKHEQLNKYAQKGQIVFAGSSLMEDFPISEMAQALPGQPVVYNRGIGGDTLDGFSARLNSAVIDLAPRKLFINIGTNDISAPDYEIEGMLAKYRAVLERIRAALPETKVIIMSYYPVNRTSAFVTDHFGARTNAEIDRVNARLSLMAQELSMGYIDVTECLRDENGNLFEELSLDGMHMYPDGYMKVLNVIRPLIY